ncbi:MAG TPA: ABC transporter ATP-binding protein [Gaiellaceae bacterium]|nr:ABC transporter ATP-binding protein [Gaiellaceae bacterium]
MTGDAPRLEARGVTVQFRGLRALSEVDLVLAKGEILGLIGPNGAGKTTLVNVLSGFQRPEAGDLVLDGRNVSGRPPRKFARLGVARTFQTGRLFGKLSVLENVELGALGLKTSARTARERSWTLLARLGLAAKAHLPAGSLPYGEQRLLGVLRALSTEPTFLLLDEPAAGLNEAETANLLAVIGAVRDDFGCGVLVIEHDMRLIMGVSERIQVLDHGRFLCVGTPEEVRRDPAVIEAYLGSSGGTADAAR